LNAFHLQIFLIHTHKELNELQIHFIETVLTSMCITKGFV